MNPVPPTPDEPPRLLHETRWLKLLQRGKWIYASRRAAGAPIRLDAVNIIAWHTDDTGHRRIVLIDEYRHPIQRWEISLPAGLLDAGETLEACAARELREETGLEATGFGPASKMLLFASAGMSDETLGFIHVFCRGQPALNPGIDGEQIRVLLLDQAGCRELLEQAGREQHAMSARLWPILAQLAATGGYAGIQLGPT